jgi:hypothetical protein
MLGKKATPQVVLLLALVMVCDTTSSAQQNGKVTALEGFPDASITIFPVTYIITGPVAKHREFYDAMMGPAGRKYFNVIDKLGLLLEENGYDKFEITDTDFRFPTEEAARNERAATFSKFVSGLDLKTDYALCTEFTLHLEKSWQEVYTVIVDAKGGIVWEDSQGPGDPDFDKEVTGGPETGCGLVVRRLVPVMGLDKLSDKLVSEETKAKLQKMRAAEPPSKSEFEAIKKRLQVMKKAGTSIRVIVYPTRVSGDRVDQTSATRLSEMLNQAELCQANVAETDLILKGDEGWPNEMKVLWLYARAAREYARENPAGSDYVLFADYWQRPTDKGIHAVHFMVCDRAGDWVIVDLQNSHQEDFQRIDPKTLADCDRLVLERLKGYLR